MTGLEEAQMRLVQAVSAARRAGDGLLADDLDRAALGLLGLRCAHGLITPDEFHRLADDLRAANSILR